MRGELLHACHGGMVSPESHSHWGISQAPVESVGRLSRGSSKPAMMFGAAMAAFGEYREALPRKPAGHVSRQHEL